MKPKHIIYSARAIGAELRKVGVPVLKTSEGDDCEDGEISISEAVHIQVGVFENYAAVSRFDGECFHIEPMRDQSDIATLAADVRKALSEVPA